MKLSRYIYGTTRLGDESIEFDDRVKIARAAMDAGIWFHTSHQYGNALQVLRTAFDQDRANVPYLIFKIGWDSLAEIESQIRLQIEALDIPMMPVGQLCLGENLAKEFVSGGPGIDGLNRLKDQGLVGSYVVEVFPWTSAAPTAAIQSGNADKLVDAFIFYLNPLQRFASNELWDLIRDQGKSIVAMRTVSGGNVHRMRDGAAPDYLRDRAAQVAPIFDRSGIPSWTEFCMRYVYGFPQVLATVGATSKQENLAEFLSAYKNAQPLPPEIHEEIVALQREWADSHDAHAEPWSM